MQDRTSDDLVITPTYNERENINAFLDALFAAFPVVDVLVVDDSSPDGTARLVEERAKGDPRVRLLSRPGKMGLGSAYREGFRRAVQQGYERVYEMDADLSHDPKYLPVFADELRAGADIVLGSRRVKGGSVEGWGPLRHVISGGGSIYSRVVLGIGVRDMTTGFKGFRRRVLETLPWDSFMSGGFFFQVETNYRALKAGCTIKEVPILFRDRTAGRSKMSRKIFVEALRLTWKLRFQKM